MPDFWSINSRQRQGIFPAQHNDGKDVLKDLPHCSEFLEVKNYPAFSHHFCVSGWLKQGEQRAFFCGIINSTQDSLQICLILNLGRQTVPSLLLDVYRLNVASTRFFGGFIYQTAFSRKSKEFWEKSSFFMTFFWKRWCWLDKLKLSLWTASQLVATGQGSRLCWENPHKMVFFSKGSVSKFIPVSG